MPAALTRLFRLVLALMLSVAVMARPALAQSIVRDAETEALMLDMSRDLIIAAGLQPRNVQIVMILDGSINAFVAGGQIVYMHSGLITSADNANQVQGVIAHEIGHIEGGHVVRFSEGAKAATGIMLLSLLLGAAAIAAGAGEAGAGIFAAGQQAAMGKFLAFTRTQESSADAAAARYLNAAGVSGRGLIDFFKKLQNQEYRLGIQATDSYDRTHPLSRERVTVLTDVLKGAPAWDKPTDPAIEARFQRIKAKLKGYALDPPQVLREYPETDRSIPARYARAYAWHRSAYPEQALAEIDALLATAPHDPYFLELKGQVLLESGRPREALPALREAVQLTQFNPLIASMFGHALVATEDDGNHPEAERVLRAALAKDKDNPFAWYQLGVIYGQRGDVARAALASAERFNLEGQPRLALMSARTALAGIPQGSPDYLRAQDIEMVARTAAEQEKRR
ncbi:M48 family metalloprotease [Sphingomonas changnyeongensis]|uniref:M48 family metalloprotease n=1 Tax=Sphingomonas changnyeongensis TaxID=2698679 RepID=UPI00191BEBFC|nr:M48 family metalloprotease [Sphingomonas changnyeongensis]